MIEALHFIRPWWLLGLVPAIAITITWARQRAASSHWEASVAPELLAVLLEPSGGGRFRRTVWAVTLSLALATLGLAGPTWQRLPLPVTQKSEAMVIVLDLSLSMFAEDVAPSRLIRARQKITDVLRLRKEGFTALIAYAGDAHAVAPLTDDTRTIQNLLAALSPEMMPVFGSNVGAAMEIAHELFASAGFDQGRILLVTDGVDRLTDVTDYRKADFPVLILGVGTEAGGNIPLGFANQPNDVLLSEQGVTILARLDSDALRQIAGIAHGRYHTLSLADDDIDYLLATPLPRDDETVEVEREFDTWADMGFWTCLGLLPLALLGFRRGVLAALCLAIVPPPLQANLWDDLWQRRDQQAHEFLQEGQPESAASLFEDPQWQAAARYRSEDFAAAAEGFSGDSTPTGVYNFANSLAQQGDYETAIAAYSEVLSRAPDHEDAVFNKALVEQLLTEQQSSQGENSQKDPNGNQPEDSSSGGGNPEQNRDGRQQDDQSDQQADPGDAQTEQSETEDSQGDPTDDLSESRDEQKDALEQWLRRVPDDPGGLLRRKFRYETNQRLRSGDYTRQQTEKIW